MRESHACNHYPATVAASRVLERVGQVLGGRYRLVSPIGTGASASVYLADDVTLRRRVAVKVLHDALADDEAFLRRFRAEAQAAAALNHPNILAVHDWGQDDGVPYLVSEYLAGGSLRGMLDLGRILTPAQALVVGLETARGLEYAHRRGLVHRDIKPANLLFDDEGRLRIADFGLARALAEAAWTEPMGAVLGTARYASPEQARGESLDGRSDVYSLALVIIEAVTGSVPFTADTTIGTLMARVDAPLPVPDELGALAPILRAVGTPDPKLRPDAAEFGNALVQAARAFDRPTPLPLAGTRVSGELEEPLDPTETVVTGADGTPASGGDDGDGGHGAGPVAVAGAGLLAAAATGAAPGADVPIGTGGAEAVAGVSAGRWRGGGVAGPAPYDDLPDDVDGSGGTGDDPAGVTSGFVTLADLSGPSPSDPDATGLLDRPVGPGDTATTPVLYDVELDDSDHGPAWRGGASGSAAGAAEGYPTTRAARRADRRLVRAEAKAEVARAKASARAARGRRRWPRVLAVVVLVLALAAGGAAAWYEWIRVPTYAVPTLVGSDASTLDAATAGHEWRVTRNEEFADGTAPGRILSQSPAPGTELARGGTIVVTVSLGPPPVAVPTDLVGLPLADATARLAAVGLGVGDVTRAFDETAPVDTVLGLADGTPTQIPKGSAVGLTVSQGPQPRTIPDGLVGVPAEQATASLEALGLVPKTSEEFSETVAKGITLSVTPPAGSQVPKGSTVEVVVSKGPPTVTVPNVTGLSVVDAGTALEGAGLVVSGIEGSPTKKVTATDPAAGQVVRKGTKVTIITDK